MLDGLLDVAPRLALHARGVRLCEVEVRRGPPQRVVLAREDPPRLREAGFSLPPPSARSANASAYRTDA